MTVDVVVNGESHRVPEGTTIGLLLDTLGLQRDGIAVAVDRIVVPRSEHDEHIVTPGAHIELIRAVGGG